MRFFDLCDGLFHMVFNKIVENFHRAFTICAPRLRTLAQKLLTSSNFAIANSHTRSVIRFCPA